MLFFQLYLITLSQSAFDSPDQMRVEKSIISKNGIIKCENGSKDIKVDFSVCAINGDDIESLSVFPFLTMLNLHNATLSQKALLSISVNRNLSVLRLSKSNVNDQDLEHVSKLILLESLFLTNTRISDKGIINMHLASCKTLKKLDLGNTAISDRSLCILQNNPSIEYLNVAGSDVTDLGFSSIDKVGKISELKLSNTKVGDKGLEGIGKLKQLCDLDMRATNLKGKTLFILCGNTKLKHLILAETAIDDSCLPSLIVMVRQLETLDITDTRITPNGILKLKTINHRCVIHASPFSKAS